MFVVIISPLVGNQSYSVAIKANVGNYPGIFCEISSVLHNIIMDVNIVVVLEFGFSSYHYIRNRHEYIAHVSHESYTIDMHGDVGFTNRLPLQPMQITWGQNHITRSLYL